MIEADLRAYLIAQPAITSLVGTRVYPMTLPQGAVFPAITYQRVGGAPEFSHDGGSDVARARMQLDCWSTTYGDAASLGLAVKQALSGYRGPMGATPDVAARITNAMDLDEPELSLRRRMLDVALWHKEA